jgi:DNA helicase-2/ATP-dependent DNA helicase PcrA
MVPLRHAERTVMPKPVVPSRGGVASPSQLSEGQVIEHQRFGVGKVLKVEGTGENTKATVQFQNAGVKQLLLKFARFTILS